MDKFVALALVRRRMLPYKANLPALISVRDTNFCGQKQQTTHFYSGDPQQRNYSTSRAEKIHAISGWSGSYNRNDDSLRFGKEKATLPALVSARNTNFHGQKHKIYYGSPLRADMIRTASGKIESPGRDNFPKFPKGHLDEFETYVKLREGLHYKVRRHGGSDQHPKDGDKVEVDYTECDQEGKKIAFDTIEVIVGDKRTFGPGFDEAIRNIKRGDDATFIIHKNYWPSRGIGEKVGHFLSSLFSSKGKYKVYYVTLLEITSK